MAIADPPCLRTEPAQQILLEQALATGRRPRNDHPLVTKSVQSSARHDPAAEEVHMDEKRLSLRAALAQDRLEEFVRQAEARGVTLDKGSDFERGLALLMVRRLKAEGEQGGAPARGNR
jgi:hypothetical protein